MTFTVSALKAAAGPEPPEPAEMLSPHYQQTFVQISQVCLLLGAPESVNETGSDLFSVNLKGSSELRGRIRTGPLRGRSSCGVSDSGTELTSCGSCCHLQADRWTAAATGRGHRDAAASCFSLTWSSCLKHRLEIWIINNLSYLSIINWGWLFVLVVNKCENLLK